MAAATITKQVIPRSSAGYNLTDSAHFATLVAGSGNGVKFAYEAGLSVILKNDTGGAAVFKFLAQLAAAYTTYGVTLTHSVANGKTYIWHPETLFRDSTGFITIECDVAGKVLVIEP